MHRSLLNHSEHGCLEEILVMKIRTMLLLLACAYASFDPSPKRVS